MEIPYTICFCVSGDSVLMLRRVKPPNEGKWNGLGGKIEAGESPTESVAREVVEEAGADVSRSLRYAGVVSWNSGADPTSASRGMHVFVAELSGVSPEREASRETPEGLLSWKDLSWVCDPQNGEVVSNIPCFLPDALASEGTFEFRCEYEGGRLVGVAVKPL